MSKRNRPTTAAQATHRRLRHAYRSAYNSPEGKAARAAAGKPSTPAKLAATKRAASPTPSPAPKTTTQG
jgi:hypothetical protein